MRLALAWVAGLAEAEVLLDVLLDTLLEVLLEVLATTLVGVLATGFLAEVVALAVVDLGDFLATDDLEVSLSKN